MRSTLQLVAAAALIGLAASEMFAPNCTDNKDGRKLACYTCMGRDFENCNWGLTCCKGSCFKLIDDAHDLIVKGCTSKEEEDASMKVRELDVKLYWDKDAKVKGESYFCKGAEFCNAVNTAFLSLAPLAAAVAFRV